MSHSSRLACVVIDVPHDKYEASLRFYADLVGHPGETDEDEPGYATYGQSAPGVELMVQAVGDPTPRVHLDIETDDIEAEVARLVALGATVVDRIQRWVVMRDPIGTVFCVVRVQMPEIFAAHAKTWAS